MFIKPEQNKFANLSRNGTSQKLATLTHLSSHETKARVSVVRADQEKEHSLRRLPGLVPILEAQSPAEEGKLSLLPDVSAQFEGSKNVFEWKEKVQGSAGILLQNREKFRLQ